MLWPNVVPDKTIPNPNQQPKLHAKLELVPTNMRQNTYIMIISNLNKASD